MGTTPISLGARSLNGSKRTVNDINGFVNDGGFKHNLRSYPMATPPINPKFIPMSQALDWARGQDP